MSAAWSLTSPFKWKFYERYQQSCDFFYFDASWDHINFQPPNFTFPPKNAEELWSLLQGIIIKVLEWVWHVDLLDKISCYHINKYLLPFYLVNTGEQQRQTTVKAPTTWSNTGLKHWELCTVLSMQDSVQQKVSEFLSFRHTTSFSYMVPYHFFSSMALPQFSKDLSDQEFWKFLSIDYSQGIQTVDPA